MKLDGGGRFFPVVSWSVPGRPEGAAVRITWRPCLARRACPTGSDRLQPRMMAVASTSGSVVPFEQASPLVCPLSSTRRSAGECRSGDAADSAKVVGVSGLRRDSAAADARDGGEEFERRKLVVSGHGSFSVALRGRLRVGLMGRIMTARIDQAWRTVRFTDEGLSCVSTGR